MRKKLLIFDFDGTIADTLIIAEQVMADLAPEFNLPKVTRQEIIVLKHKTIPELLKLSGLSWTQLPLFVRKARGGFKKYLHMVQPIQDMPEILQVLSQRGYRMGILTSNSKEGVRTFLASYELQMFEFILAPNSLFGKSKVLRKILKRNALLKTEAVMIGDEIRDINAAQKVGIDSVAVTWGFNSEDLLDAHLPRHLIRNPGDLLGLFP